MRGGADGGGAALLGAGPHGTVWLGFACYVHADQLIAARRLLARDRDRLRTRQERERTLLDGKRWAGLRDGPLARGRAADDLMTRARAWAAAHPWPPDPAA